MYQTRFLAYLLEASTKTGCDILGSYPSARHERGRKDSGLRISGVISTPPAFQPEMRAVAPSTPRLRQGLSDDAERLRGGALSCACCGGGGGSQPSLEPDPEAREIPKVAQTTPPVPINQTQQTAQLPDSSQSPQTEAILSSKTADPSLSVSSSKQGTPRQRAVSHIPPPKAATPHQGRLVALSLPARSLAQPASGSPSIVPPTFEGTGNRGNNPLIPPSVSTTGRNLGPPVTASFARN